ncbi:hypothetical protein M422DRAFT_234553 [Sphaerobolus stellatus SS14]|uniref:Uncharacterized protein n=1 Tax=Sphaerobolus stellatus (strain SS14) TaxID=990650 RepID=A0A0C9TN87_SPHS4|nr:hypothetical protein M422DRAFT_234553 [Sphaerobolus stellatus SS14]
MFSSYTIRRPTQRRPRGPPPTFSQLVSASRDVIRTLKELGIDACFVGGMACKLYGTTRQPGDLDIFCLTTSWAQEDLKRRLTETNSCFYLIPSRTPGATWKVLWYYIKETQSCCKVDILFPGTMDFPDIPVSVIDRSNPYAVPCVPLSALLLLKLQGWIHHGEAVEFRYRSKQPNDAKDIKELLVIARRQHIRPRTEVYLLSTFISEADSRVKTFVTKHPSSRDDWTTLGFSLPEDAFSSNSTGQKDANDMSALLKRLSIRYICIVIAHNC